jgi:hypothetical protein
LSKGKILVPTIDIDLAWHAHQCFHDEYANYTKSQIGYLLNHDDNIGGADLEKGYARTFVLWSKTYNEPYSDSFKPNFYAWQRKHTVKSILCPPVGLYRLFEWRKYTKAVEVAPAALLVFFF